MNIDDFLNGPFESYLEIPGTHLSLSPSGKIRNDLTGDMWGHLVFLEDVEALLSGRLPIWQSGDAIIQTADPPHFFKRRTRRDKENEVEFLLAA